jgi:hypothetical protein
MKRRRPPIRAIQVRQDSTGCAGCCGCLAIAGIFAMILFTMWLLLWATQ